MHVIIIILTGILFASLGQILWKHGMIQIGPVSDPTISSLFPMIINPFIIGGVVCYGLSTLFWLIALSREDLSFVYPFIALTFVIIFAASAFLFNEHITAMRLTGACIILIGTIVLVKG